MSDAGVRIVAYLSARAQQRPSIIEMKIVLRRAPAVRT